MIFNYICRQNSIRNLMQSCKIFDLCSQNIRNLIEMTEKDLKKLRKQVACFMRRLYERGLTTASGGNISVRLNDGNIHYSLRYG